ncbi:hypothetical protein U1Q18_042541 [Sarracenia purpurea var. burkii]
MKKEQVQYGQKRDEGEKDQIQTRFTVADHGGSDHSQPKHQLDSRDITGQPVSSQSGVTPPKYVKNVPVAAAAAAAAAVVASSMVVVVTKTSADSSLDLPTEATATTTAAAVLGTTAAVSKQHENIVARSRWPSGEDLFTNRVNDTRVDGYTDVAVYEQQG